MLSGKVAANPLVGRMAKKPVQPDHRWRIVHLKGTPANTIGYVDAPDAEAE